MVEAEAGKSLEDELQKDASCQRSSPQNTTTTGTFDDEVQLEV
jgi:hypothetical protein